MTKRKSNKYWVLFCHSKKPPLLCGIYFTKKEALAVAKEIKDCLARHTIEKKYVRVVSHTKKSINKKK